MNAWVLLIAVAVLVCLGWWSLTVASCRWCGRDECDTCGVDSWFSKL